MYSSRAQQGGHSTNYNVAEAAEACDRRIAELEEVREWLSQAALAFDPWGF